MIGARKHSRIDIWGWTAIEQTLTVMEPPDTANRGNTAVHVITNGQARPFIHWATYLCPVTTVSVSPPNSLVMLSRAISVH